MPWVNDAVLVVERGMTGATGNLYFGLHETHSMAFMAHLLRPGEVFVDAGANIGSFTVLAGKVSGAIVHAFEPVPATFARLQANIAANGIVATAHEVALGDHDGEVRFSADLDCRNGISDEGALVVKLRRLDDLGLSPVAIKADLEGGEAGMFRGARETLANPSLLAIETEGDDPEIRTMLSAAGFKERWYDAFTRELSAEPAPGGGNALFIRNEAEVVARLKTGPAIKWGGLRL